VLEHDKYYFHTAYSYFQHQSSLNILVVIVTYYNIKAIIKEATVKTTRIKKSNQNFKVVEY